MRLLADGGDQLVAERRQLLGDEEGIAASAHVKHPVLVEVEFGLEAVVAAQDLHREPRRHDLGDGSRSEGPVGVLGDQLVALLVNHEHDPRWSHACDLLLDAGERRDGRQEQGESEGEGEQARPHGDSRRSYLQAQGRNRQTAFILCVGRGQAPKLAAARTCVSSQHPVRLRARNLPFLRPNFRGILQLPGELDGGSIADCTPVCRCRGRNSADRRGVLWCPLRSFGCQAPGQSPHKSSTRGTGSYRHLPRRAWARHARLANGPMEGRALARRSSPRRSLSTASCR